MSSDTHEITACDVCGSSLLISVLDLGRRLMGDDLVPIGNPNGCLEKSIEALFGETRLTAHQRFQLAKRGRFPVSRHYRSRFTADVLDPLVRHSARHTGGGGTGRTVLVRSQRLAETRSGTAFLGCSATGMRGRCRKPFERSRI